MGYSLRQCIDIQRLLQRSRTSAADTSTAVSGVPFSKGQVWHTSKE